VVGVTVLMGKSSCWTMRMELIGCRGDCVIRPFYNLPFPDTSDGEWWGYIYGIITVCLSGLILSVGIGKSPSPHP
jgi:hypothetical protein